MKQSLRKVLADRLSDLMQRTPALDTQVKVARRSGVAQTTVSRILRGTHAATLDNIEAIAQAFRVDPCELLTESRPGSVIELPAAQLAQLPDEGRQRIARFVQFTLNEYAAENPHRLTFVQEAKAPTESVAAVRRAAARPLPTDQQGNEQKEQGQQRRKRGRPRSAAA